MIFSLLIFSLTGLFGIDCKVIISGDYSISDKFNKIPFEAIPVLATAGTVYKKEYFTVNLLINGCKPDGSGMADSVYDIKIIKPDGKIYIENSNINAINTKISNPQIFLMAGTVLKVCFEPEDQFGDYSIEINLRDNISKDSKDFKSSLKLVKFEYKKFFDDDDSLNKWMNGYYFNPDPGKAIDAFLYFNASKISDNKNSFWPCIAFFQEIFSNNTYLFPFLEELFESRDNKTKMNIIFLYKICGYDLKGLTGKMSKDEAGKIGKAVEAVNIPDIYGKITSPSQLDMLWGTFLASGSYKPVLAIVNSLELCKYKGYIERYKTSDKTAEDYKNAMSDAIYQSARWSLGSNCSQHRLVKDYCNYIYDNEKLSGDVKNELGEILGR
jgi:hypothetical protein